MLLPFLRDWLTSYHIHRQAALYALAGSTQRASPLGDETPYILFGITAFLYLSDEADEAG
jgi:hypothetical protein